VNNLNVGVFRTVPGQEGGFIEANPALARIHGFDSVDELMRMKVADLYLEPEDRRAGMEELARNGQAMGLELQLRRKDGQVVYAAVNATAHRGADGQVEWIDGVLEDVTERRRLERQILSISDEEQARIGHELHDGLCQQLIGLTFDANRLLEEAEERRPPDLKVAKRLAEGLDGAITEARQLSRGLFPVRLEGAGLLSALEELAGRTEKRFGVTCRLEAAGELALPSKTVATQLYRIAQEALSNAARHSGGKNIRLRLAAEPGGLVLRVQDDGSGFNPSRESTGMGLHIIRYRARSIGAKLDVMTSSGGGTEVRVRVPLR
jgi:PAS domain S-box-containing protein